MSENLEHLKYPVGRLKLGHQYNEEQKETWISTIEGLPENLLDAAIALNPTELLRTYRPEGWNIQQLIHHLADSHMNSFIRFKLALTEENPTVKSYAEGKWAEMGDVDESVEDSIMIIRGVHNRWVKILRSMSETDYQKTFVHPESKRVYNLYDTLAMYAWHTNHHLAHIDIALKS